MSTESNVFSQGGGGTIFEISVQTAYFITFLLGGQVPGLPESHITYFRQQSGSEGYATDDVLLRCEDENGSHQVLMQIKHLINITAADKTFSEVLTAAWKDFNNTTLFDPSKDKIYLVSSGLPMVVKNHLLPVLAWAKAKDNSADFLNEVTRITNKKKYYDLFKSIITATTATVTDDDLFRFMKCYEVLDYDLDQPASVTKASILTSLGLAKDTPSSATSIWNDVFNMLSESNSKGGQYDLSGRPAAILDKLKKGYYNTIQKDLFRISTASQELLDVVTDTIGSYHLTRQDLLSEGLELLTAGQVVLITGDAGAGKSAMAKALLAALRRDATGYVVVFKSDELLRDPLRKWFADQGIFQSLKEIFSHFALLPNAIIYVDSMERLLEGEADAFRQIQKAVEELPSLKLIGTCRKGLLNLIQTKFFAAKPFAELQVPYLTTWELNLVCQHEPALRPAADNTELQQLIRIPKYLDFAYKAIAVGGGDYSTMSEAKFQATLWSAIVENVMDGAKPGMPSRRTQSFIDIAVVRSRKMALFVGPTSPPDAEALDLLKRETVLLQQGTFPLYAPAHDVLEDWALARYTDNLFATVGASGNFFTQLGTEPAMRRAYRLWVQLALKEQDNTKIAFFTNNLTDANLDGFWHIESLIAVLNSTHCERFLRDHLALLKANDWTLLFKVIQIMRTACRVNGNYLDQKVLVPEGASWTAILKILAEDKSNIPVAYLPVLQSMLEEWKMDVLVKLDLPAATRDAGLLAFYLIEHHLAAKGTAYRGDKPTEKLVTLLFAFAGGITTELQAEFDRAPGLMELDRGQPGNNRLITYGRTLLEQVLKGPAASQVARFLPDVIFDLARQRWYRKPRPKLEGMEEMVAQMTESSMLDKSFRFGLASDHPIRGTESALSTPLLWLLEYHTDKALDFIIHLFNHATDHYKAHVYESDKVTEITLRLPNGTNTMQTASPALWTMYRGHTGMTNALLTSILMALEKYLLRLGAQGETKGDLLRHCLKILLTNSHSVATTAVVASVVQAYPLMAGEWMLAVLDQKDFYDWDIARYTQDLQSPFLMQDGSLDVRERTTSHYLVHRKQFDAGLRGFVIYYWVTIGQLIPQLEAMIDRLYAAADPKDLDWRKTLEHIDGRLLRYGKEVEINGRPGFMIETEFSPEVAAMVEAFRADFEKERAERIQVNELKAAFDGTQAITLAYWLQIYESYKTVTAFNSLRHAPGLLAAVGLRDFWPKLTDEQRKQCIAFVGQIAEGFIIAGLTHHQLGQLSTSIFDTSAILTVMAQLLSNPDIASHEDDVRQIEEMIFRCLIAYWDDNILDYNEFVKALHRHLWPTYPETAFRMWKGALALGSQKYQLPTQQGHEDYRTYLEAVYEFTTQYYQQVRQDQVEIDIEKFDLKKFKPWALARAIRLIPDHEPPKVLLDFLARVLTAYVKHQTDAPRRYEDNLHELAHVLQLKLAQIFLDSAEGVGPGLMDFFCKLLITTPVIAAIQRDGDTLFSFFMDTLRQTIHNTNTALEQEQAPFTRTTRLFQAMWTSLDHTSTQTQRGVYWPLLMLNINWGTVRRNWPPITGMKDFFMRYIEAGTAVYPAAAINLVATVGSEELLPDALLTLVPALKKTEAANELNLLTDTKAELLAHRIYEDHLQAVRSQPALMEAYLWLLRRLIDLGSTDAYWLNEFVISFHRTQHQ